MQLLVSHILYATIVLLGTSSHELRITQIRHYLQMDHFASPVRYNCSLHGQLEVLRLNGVCTMEMVKSLMEMVTKLRCEVQVLKSDNTALKLQLQDLRQILTPPSSISTEALSSTHDASAKTYRDVLTSGGGHPASTAISSGPIWTQPADLTT
jgi:hypothetical protein